MAAIRKGSLSLDMFASLLKMQICLCGACENLRTEMRGYSQPGPRWSSIFSFFENRALCPFLRRIHDAINGSVCRWNVCYKCMLDGDVSAKPVNEVLTGVVDINTFDVLHTDNKKGECSKHGDCFAPYLIGDPPELMSIISDVSFSTQQLLLCPLQLAWSGKEIISETRSGFAFLPNLQRWTHTIMYRIDYDVSIYPLDGSNCVPCYTYILSRETKPKGAYTRLEDLLGTQHPKRNIWMLQNDIMGTSNGGIGVAGDLLSSNSRRGNMYGRFRGATSTLPIHEEFGRENLSKRILQNSNCKERQNNSLSKPEDAAMFLTFNQRKPGVIAHKHTDQKSKTIATRNNVKNRFILFDRPDVKGDPLYAPAVSDILSSDSEAGTFSLAADNGFQRNFCFEQEVRLAEKSTERYNAKFRKLRRELTASASQDVDSDCKEANSPLQQCETYCNVTSESVQQKMEELSLNETKQDELSQGSFRTSYKPIEAMEYRIPILRAPSSWFENNEDIEVEEKQSLDIVEAHRLLEQDEYPFVRSSMQHDEFGRINFASSEKEELANDLSALAVHVDVDSIDVITVSLAGGAFANSQANIFLTWNHNFVKDEEVQIRNNGFIKLHQAYS